MNLEIPINRTSLGQVGYGIAVEFFRRDIYPNLFFIGNVDLAPFDLPEGFPRWLETCNQKALRKLNRADRSVKLWHISGSHHRLGDHSTLFTVHETDRLTEAEKNILRQHDKILVTSTYSRDVFAAAGIQAEVCPNFFDADHFRVIEDKKEGMEGAVQFGLNGKMERRKNTLEIMLLWAELFGGKKEFRLNCCIHNMFKDAREQEQMIMNAFGGQRPPWNVNFLPFSEKNFTYNQVLNNNDIDLTGLSGAEGWNLPAFTCIALGKQAVVMNAHGHKDFARPGNCILVEPGEKVELIEPPFYIPGADFNQGRMFSLDKDAARAGMLAALENLQNPEGLKLQSEFSVGRVVDLLL